jgi:drug/metabolite transporter (DMT)-like permease
VRRIFLVETNAASPAPEFSRLIPVRIASSSGRAPSRAIVWLALVFLTTVWAVNFIVGKIALRYLPAMTLASIRVVLAGIFMILLNPLCRRLPAFRKPVIGLRDFSASLPASSNPSKTVIPSLQGTRDLLFSLTSQKSRPTLHDLWTFLYLGFLGVTVNQVCFTIGLHYTSVTHSAIIVGMGPIYALVLAVLFRLESATFRKILGMTVSLLGVMLLATSGDSAHHAPTLLGDFITFFGSLGFAFYAVLGKRVAARYDALTMTTYNFLFGALFVLPIAINRAIAIGPVSNWLAIPWPAWASLIYMALFSSSVAYLFYYWLLRYLEVTQLAAYNYLLPVSATLLGIVFLGERGSRAELLGGGLALAGVYFVESTRKS